MTPDGFGTVSFPGPDGVVITFFECLACLALTLNPGGHASWHNREIHR